VGHLAGKELSLETIVTYIENRKIVFLIEWLVLRPIDPRQPVNSTHNVTPNPQPHDALHTHILQLHK